MARKTTSGAQSPLGAEGFARQVAANLRRLRREAGWSLVQLSSRAGVSRAMLSQVETGKTTPTIAVLWKIATGFGVPFAELLREEAHAEVTVVRAGTIPAITSPDRRFRSTPLLPAAIGPGVELYRITIDPGGVSRSAPHAAGTFEVVSVDRGRLKLTVGDATHELEPGDVATFAADVEHAYEAIGDAACVLYDLIKYAVAPKRTKR
jgi:transcriptional regulator with XRE-family HTH domain